MGNRKPLNCSLLRPIRKILFLRLYYSKIKTTSKDSTVNCEVGGNVDTTVDAGKMFSACKG